MWHASKLRQLPFALSVKWKFVVSPILLPTADHGKDISSSPKQPRHFGTGPTLLPACVFSLNSTEILRIDQ
jgi:hypothetical protein